MMEEIRCAISEEKFLEYKEEFLKNYLGEVK